MNQNFYGRASVLDPPILIGGTAYGVAVQFRDETAHGAPVVVSGVIASIVVDGDYRDIICERAPQRFSRTISDEHGNAFEQEYDAIMGGNVAQTHEPQRGFSRFGARSFRGDDGADRARPGDALHIHGRSFQVVEAVAMAVAPAQVRWQGGSEVGIAPRMPGTEGMATDESSDVAANRAHWRDTVRIHDPHGRFPGQVGQAFQIRRDLVFDSETPPEIAVDERDGDGDFAVLDPADYLLLCPEGLLLLEDDIVGPMLANGLCVRARGRTWTHSGSFQARQIMEFAEAINALDGAWLEVPLNIGGTPAIAGSFALGGPGPSTQDCDGGLRRVGNWVIGNNRSILATWREGLENAGQPVSTRFVATNNTTGGGGTRIAFFDGGLPALSSIDCGAGAISNADLLADTAIGSIWPWVDFPPTGLPTGTHIGAEVTPPLVETPGAWPVAGPGSFRFDMKELGEMPRFFRDLPPEAEILAAWALVRVENLLATEWDFEVEAELGRTAGVSVDGTRRVRLDINGVTSYEWELGWESPETETPPSAIDTASMALYLIGERRDTRLVESLFWPSGFGVPGATEMIDLEVSGWRYRSFGSSVRAAAGTSRAKSGQWRRLNALGLARGLHDAAHSQYGRLFVAPGRDVSIESSETRLMQYARAVGADQSLDVVQTATTAVLDYRANGAFMTFTDWQMSNLHVRFRMPGGVIGRKRFPLVMPPI